ncbi:hypothetical protein GTO27_10290 [Candidatus Bathyarchaeota archaeon]|nr:hypothetical protein [Candidatus Bathyarchaeota archaeon]
MKVLRAEIGIAILIGVAILIGIIMPIAFPFPGMSVFLIFTLPWMFAGIASRINFPFALCVFAGMALYILDRRSFLNRRSGNKDTAVFLAILGLALIVESVTDGILNLSWAAWEQSMWGPLSREGSMVLAFRLVFNSLVFLSGVLLLLDQGKILEDKSLGQSSRPRLDAEARTRYPRDLFDRYVREYPHNPEGVLEWHIHKKMKEGKTREQAIEELAKGSK